jgi:hypothetical protein
MDYLSIVLTPVRIRWTVPLTVLWKDLLAAYNRTVYKLQFLKKGIFIYINTIFKGRVSRDFKNIVWLRKLFQ